MGRVRPFEKPDISQVADLHRRVFRTASKSSPQLERAYDAYFNRLFLNNPGGYDNLPSLVYEDDNRTITGFLGVVPQPMWLHGRPILAAVSSQFIVEPSRRSTLAALELLKAYLWGPQELSLADEAGESSRKLWKGFGGSATLLYGIYWIRILRPAQAFRSWLAMRPKAAMVAAAARPFCRIMDAIAAPIPRSPAGAVPEVGGAEDATPEAILGCLEEFSSGRRLRPAYDHESLRRILETLEKRKGPGELRRRVVRDSKHKIIGWYIYHAKHGGLGEVLQLGAEENSHGPVLRHLFLDAWQHGVAALSGRLEPEFMDELDKNRCLLHHRGHWMLVHSRNPEALQAIRSGDAFLTRLEGEWPLHFQ
jgi:hypothetical protein